jgi:hypothetical protein
VQIDDCFYMTKSNDSLNVMEKEAEHPECKVFDLAVCKIVPLRLWKGDVKWNVRQAGALTMSSSS